VLVRHLARAVLACGLLAATAAPASAQTQQADAVALARTLADGFTAIEPRRADARAAVRAWNADQARCTRPRLRSRAERVGYGFLRAHARHTVALRALAPELEQLAERLRSLPVSDPAIRGGIAEIVRDYRNAREAMDAEPPTLCAIVRAVRGRGPIPAGVGDSEDVRSTPNAVRRRTKRLRAAQRALLRVEVDPRLAQSLDSVIGHAAGGLFSTPIDRREHFAPPFTIVTDPAGLARLRAEAGQVAAAADSLAAARRPVARHFRQAIRRIRHCRPAVNQAAKRRPEGTFDLLLLWSFGELAAAIAGPAEQFRADVAAVPVTDPALADLVARASTELEDFDRVPRVDICGELRAWRRAGWPRRGGIVDDEIVGGFDVGGELLLDEDAVDAAVLRRRGVAPEAVRALTDPLGYLLEAFDPSSAASTRSLQATALQALR
jgi:hypothetical protein